MAEYIERETAIDVIMSEPTDAHYPSWYADKIESISVADVAPVRHGVVIESIENGKMKRIFSCCGEDFTKLTMWMWPNYCPNCGAKMNMEEEDG